jgi:PadR family transcriptional regulator AphA
MSRTSADELLLGEWACLGVLHENAQHGFAVAKRLRPDGDIGRVWSLSRPLTYRSLDELVARGAAHAVGSAPGAAGGPRTLLAPTRHGRALFRRWMRTPVAHLRDVRSELLLKLVLARQLGFDVRDLLLAQQKVVSALTARRAAQLGDGAASYDIVAAWRAESAEAVARFVEAMLELSPPAPPAYRRPRQAGQDR